jgi:hypothetical protein
LRRAKHRPVKHRRRRPSITDDKTYVVGAIEWGRKIWRA